MALNGRFSGTPQPTGTQTVAFQLFDAIIRSPRTVDIVVFADPRLPGVAAWRDIPRTRLVETPFQTWSRNRAQLWEQFRFPLLCRQWQCGVAHHPISTNPVWHPGCQSVVTFHDLNFYRHPEWFTRSFCWAQYFTQVAGAKRAERVVTISNYVRDQVREYLDISPDRLRMVYNGVKPLKWTTPAAASGPPRLLCVGSLQPHKNLTRMIRAFQSLRAEMPGLELHVVGRPQARFARDPDLPPLLESPGVKLLGYLSEEDLAAAYRDSSVFCFPSLDEGFGLPILEAMAAGTVVVTSNLSCLPEIAGQHAILVDPLSAAAIAAGLRHALTLDAAKRAAMVAGGREWAARFTWQRAADEYLKIYSELAS